MFPPKKILFPVDFSDRCADASRMVEIFAGHFQAELVLVHVVEPFTNSDIAFDPTPGAERELGKYLATELKHLDVTRTVLHGDPASIIAEYARKHEFNLVMLPTHGYGHFRRLLLGSVTAKVLHDANCPVWTGVQMEQVPRLEDIAFRRIVCALDLGKQSCETLRWANQFAAEFGANLSIVHVGQQAESHEQAVDRINEVQQKMGPVCTIAILPGEIAPGVCSFAASDKADLLVIGRSLEDGMMGRLKTNAYSIIRQAPCPVVSV